MGSPVVGAGLVPPVSDRGPAPTHVGIIMDGNGRWAKARRRPASFGHRAGVRAIKRVLEGCEELGIDYLSVYAFSTENWTRPEPEVRALMRLFHETMQREIDEMHRRGVRILFSGRREGLSPKMQQRIDESVSRTAGNTKGTLNVCLNYGGRAEIVDAVRAIIREGLPADSVNESTVASHLYQPQLPDLDLLIRTAGESRISNFQLWEGAYAELVVTETLWPDFDVPHLRDAVTEFHSRVRRFGGRVKSELDQ